MCYASYLGDGSGNCGEGNAFNDWLCEQTVIGIGLDTSLVLTATDQPHIAYYDDSGGFPVVVSFNGSSWESFWIEQVGKQTGAGVSLLVGTDGEVHIAYYNTTDNTLEWAVPSSSGNCGLSLDWQCTVIANVGDTANGDVAMVRDGNGYPMIAYRDLSTSQPQLRAAREGGAVPGATLNCGPGNLWSCSVLVTASVVGSNVADAVGVALQPSGMAVIAYRYSSLLGGGWLQATYEGGQPVFSDGFELGDTSRWSAVAP